MPRFYFSLQNTRGIIEDDIGQDLPGLKDARSEATESAREILAENVRHASNAPLIAVIIRNEEGQELTRIQVKDLLPEPLK